MSSIDATLAGQRGWANGLKLEVDEDGYTARLADNLFMPLSPAAAAEFGRGSGGELGKGGERGKMQALHSSSALACNFFDYWRTHDRAVLQSALALSSPIVRFRFEAQFPTGVRGTMPNLDVALELEDGSLVGVESKFLEPYRPKSKKPAFSDAYFPSGIQLWSIVGLPKAQALVNDLHRGVIGFRHVDAAQLLKHALGLWKANLSKAHLWYFWFDVGGELGEAHAQEIEVFRTRVGDELRFRAMTYGTLFEKLSALAGGEHSDYLAYLSARYSSNSDSLPGTADVT